MCCCWVVGWQHWAFSFQQLLRQVVWNIGEGGLRQYPFALTGLARGMYVVVVESEEVRYYNRLLKF